MQNLNFTRWLGMVWDALHEQDQVKRDHLLQAADEFLQIEDQDSGSELPRMSRQKMAAQARASF